MCSPSGHSLGFLRERMTNHYRLNRTTPRVNEGWPNVSDMASHFLVRRDYRHVGETRSVIRPAARYLAWYTRGPCPRVNPSLAQPAASFSKPATATTTPPVRAVRSRPRANRRAVSVVHGRCASPMTVQRGLPFWSLNGRRRRERRGIPVAKPPKPHTPHTTATIRSPRSPTVTPTATRAITLPP